MVITTFVETLDGLWVYCYCDAPIPGGQFFSPILVTRPICHDREISVTTGCLVRVHDPVARSCHSCSTCRVPKALGNMPKAT